MKRYAVAISGIVHLSSVYADSPKRALEKAMKSAGIKADIVEFDSGISGKIARVDLLGGTRESKSWYILSNIKLYKKDTIYSEIRTSYEEGKYVYVDAWFSDNDNEEGLVIARINVNNLKVIYNDKRAIKDSYAQRIIKETLKELALRHKEK